MQRLLACDSRLAHTRFYESWNPIPLGIERGVLDERKLRGQLALIVARLLNPKFDTIHPTAWNAADEEIGFQSISIFGSAFEVQWRVPSFRDAVENDDGETAYTEFKRLLKTVAWLRRERADRPWILKVPQFTQDLPALLRAFPDARLIFVTRDEREVIASSASLVRNQMAVQSELVDADWIGREWTRKVRLRDQRMKAFLQSHSGPSVEVAYDAMENDWEMEMGRVYSILGLALPGPLLTKMRNLMRAAKSGKHRQHVYRDEEFGLEDWRARQDSNLQLQA